MARKTQPLDIPEPPAQQDDSPNDTQEPANNLVAESKIVAAEVQPRAQEEQHRAAERYYWGRELRLTRWLNWITGGAVVGGIVSLILIKQTLDATRIAADAAKTQAETARGQLELSERAWMNVSHVQLKSDLAPDVPVTVGITLKNVGKTPAQTITANLAVGPHPKCECAPLGKIEDLGSVGPGAEATVKGNMNPHPLATIEAVRRESLTISFCGEILYKDEFSKTRRTTFNMFYTPNEEKKFFRCPTGNFME